MDGLKEIYARTPNSKYRFVHLISAAGLASTIVIIGVLLGAAWCAAPIMTVVMAFSFALDLRNNRKPASKVKFGRMVGYAILNLLILATFIALFR